MDHHHDRYDLYHRDWRQIDHHHCGDDNFISERVEPPLDPSSSMSRRGISHPRGVSVTLLSTAIILVMMVIIIIMLMWRRRRASSKLNAQRLFWYHISTLWKQSRTTQIPLPNVWHVLVSSQSCSFGFLGLFSRRVTVPPLSDITSTVTVLWILQRNNLYVTIFTRLVLSRDYFYQTVLARS